MIEPMRKTTVITLSDQREATVKALRDLEILHVVAHGEESPETNAAVRKCEELEIVIRSMDDLPSDETLAPGSFAELSPAQLAIRAEELLRELGHYDEQQEKLTRETEAWAPWGDFDPAQLAQLRDQGVHVALCKAPLNEETVLPADACRQDIAADKDTAYFAVIATHELPDDLPAVTPPEQPVATMREQLAEARNEADRIRHDLRIIAQQKPGIDHELLERREMAEFLQVKDATVAAAELDRVACLTGYVPAQREQALRDAALEHGWGLIIEDIEEGDRKAPTLLTVPKWLEISNPIFDFVGIRPGYFEFDISAWFLIFFTIFFAMIFGDAGYGALIVGAALFGKTKLGEKGRVPMNLILLLGTFTVIWGGLSGAWFGIEKDHLPAFMRGLEWFDTQKNMANVQFLCFLIGAVHLSIAHGWKALVAINSPLALSQVGWIAFIWGNFFLGCTLVCGWTFPFIATVLYIVGAILILLFTAPSRNLVSTIGSGAGAILGGGVNSFVDVLSYIRLFAVGMSSMYVAQSFNDMGMRLTSIPIIGIVFAVIVILFGHTLNMGLAALSVLVHGIRLNTLEFSGHIDVTWCGIPFRAFSRRRRPSES